MIDTIIKVPYTTTPSMLKYDGPLFNPCPDPSVLEQKRQELKKWGRDLYGTSESLSLVKDASVLFNMTPTSDIIEFALQFEEDIALMHDGKLNEICFCFPSSWIPREKVGKTLEEIHRPVADGDKLVAASQKIAQTMSQQGPFRRYVWTITNNGNLSQHPSARSHIVPSHIEQLWFRTETQTTFPLGDGRSSIFFVNIQMIPLTEIWKNEQNKQLIVDSINSMSDSILNYKNLTHIKSIICGHGV